MRGEKEDKGLNKALNYCLNEFGRESQLVKSIEEMSELIQLLSQDLLQNHAIERDEKIAMEIADVKIMLKQLDLIYSEFKQIAYDKKRLELIQKTKGMLPWGTGLEG